MALVLFVFVGEDGVDEVDDEEEAVEQMAEAEVDGTE